MKTNLTNLIRHAARSVCSFSRIGQVKRKSVFSAIGILLLAVTIAQSAPPPANTSIGNQATATYTDSGNTARTATSNTVSTIVQQVSAFTLTTDGQTKFASPGAQVTYSHTLTNTGNGIDTFPLAAVNAGGNTFNLTNVTIYADANGDGVPDNSTPITTTGALASGGIFKFVVVGIVPGTQTSGQTAALSVTANGTATTTPAPAQTNTDTTTVTGNAVINVTKSISAPSGAAGSGPYTYTLTYTNNGNITSGTMTLKDVIPAGMTYVANSARWSVTGGAVVLTDANAADVQGTAPETIVYDYNVTAANQVTAVISQVTAGETRTVTFQVNVNAGQPTGNIPNTATYTYDPGTGTPVGPNNTNTPLFNVTQGAGVLITGTTVASAPQGATVSFTNPVSNLGNGTDSFDISVVNTSFPVGTTFALFKSDGQTPLVDTNGNTSPDTGNIVVSGTYNVVVQATLPPGATGGPFTAAVTAISHVNSAVTSTANDTLTAVTSETVDFTDNLSVTGGATSANGLGAGPEVAAVVTNTTGPGTTTVFSTFVNNTSTVADSYNLQASTDKTFASLVLPAGWTVTFKNGAGATLPNTGTVNAGANIPVAANVFVPAGTAPGTTQIYFRAVSPTSTVQDIIHNAVTVSTVRSLVMTPNNSAQITPGGAVVYSETLTNNGNVLEGDGAVSSTALGLANNLANWSAVIYFDTNGNGAIDAGEPVVTNLNFANNGGGGGLAPGKSVMLLIKVTADPGAAAGAVNITTVTATTTNGSYITAVPPVASITDTSTVINGQISIVKTQAPDFNNDGIADSAFIATPISVGALPGKMIRYQIVVTNQGSAAATNIFINDSTPAFTTYTSTGPATVTGGSAPSVVTVPANGAVGALQFKVGTLNPGQSATATFGVQINQ